jgi:hypothetical protein
MRTALASSYDESFGLGLGLELSIGVSVNEVSCRGSTR